MTVTERILAKQLDMDVFSNENPMVSGIAKQAINRGFENLSVNQRRVLIPFLSQPCSGHTDPAGYHNGCRVTLEDLQLLGAYEEANDPEYLKCQQCCTEAEHEAFDRQRLFEE